MTETIRECIAGALTALANGDPLMVKSELQYALLVLNESEREQLVEDEGGRRLIYDWDDESIADLLPRTLGPFEWEAP